MENKCILFDADWIVIRSELFSIQYQKKFWISNKQMLPFFEWELQNCVIWKSDLKEILKPWLLKWEWNDTVDNFLKFWFESEHKIDNRVIEVINDLRSKWIKCYLATNQEKYRTQYMKNKMGFEDIFDKIYSSCEIWHKKPNSEFYEYILEDLKNSHNILPQEVLFFDDSIEHVNSAKEKFEINAYLYTDFDKFFKIIKKIINLS